LVLKPCRWVVFFAVIPKFAPSASGFGRWTGFATVARLRAVRRVDCVGLRLAPEVVFLVFRLTPAALFFAR
jgi:hypothetical protein